jgi:hydrogenase expression/formation protein HypD
MRIPGTNSSLEKQKAAGSDIRIVFSPLESLEIAAAEYPKKVVFAGIGFETTTPGTAVTILEAEKRKISHFFLLSGHKVMPPAMKAVIKGGTAIDGFICPGHVSAVAGSMIFEFIPEQYGIPCVVSGFEPVDILQTILMLIRQIKSKKQEVEIQYKRAVTREGNPLAREMIHTVFCSSGDVWRGLGTIPESGRKLRPEYERMDAEKMLPADMEFRESEDNCLCGEILRGKSKSSECPLFGRACTPEHPQGACMVSPEGACQIHHTYTRHER